MILAPWFWSKSTAGTSLALGAVGRFEVFGECRQWETRGNKETTSREDNRTCGVELHSSQYAILILWQYFCFNGLHKAGRMMMNIRGLIMDDPEHTVHLHTIHFATHDNSDSMVEKL
jgi:hypothetical protein